MQRPSACYHHSGCVGLRLPELAFPPAGAQQLRANFIHRYRELGLQELVTVLSDCLLCRPSVQFLSPSIPIRDDVVDIADENGVMREIEQVGLLSAFGHFPLEFVAGLQKLLLDAAADRAEPGDKYREQNEDKIGRQLGTSNVEAVKGHGEEVVEG